MIPPIQNPLDSYYVCCYRDDKGVLHPNVLTIAATTRGCSAKVKEILGLTTVQRRRRNFVILPFSLRFEPRFEIIDDADDDPLPPEGAKVLPFVRLETD